MENKQPSLSEGMLQSVAPAEQKQEENQGTYLPKILDMKVYYGLGDKSEGEERKPNPHKILYYEDPTGRCYDTGKQEWLHERPEVCDHLQSRPILHDDQDIVNAIAHGVMEDQDYEALDKSGMLGELPKKLWGKIKELKDLHSKLQSEQLHKADDEGSEDSMSDKDLQPEGHGEAPASSESSEGEGRLAGDDVISEIVRLAMADADDRIRQIVREEIAAILGEGESQEPSMEQESEEFAIQPVDSTEESEEESLEDESEEEEPALEESEKPEPKKEEKSEKPEKKSDKKSEKSDKPEKKEEKSDKKDKKKD